MQRERSSYFHSVFEHGTSSPASQQQQQFWISNFGDGIPGAIDRFRLLDCCIHHFQNLNKQNKTKNESNACLHVCMKMQISDAGND
jgi:hypothetical protein